MNALPLLRKSTQFFSALFICIVASSNAHAFDSGSYTTSGSRALADSNSSGDSLLAGDNKILISRGQNSYALRLPKVFANEPSVVTGALLERTKSQESATTAYICSQTHMSKLMVTEGGLTASSSTELTKLLGLKGARDLRCAVDRKGRNLIALNLKNGAARLFALEASGSSVTQNINLPKISGRWTHVVHVGEMYVAFSDTGAAAAIEAATQNGQQVRLIRSPWSELDSHDTLSSNGRQLLRAGESQVSLTSLQAGEQNPAWTALSRISISPCSESGGCGAWISPEGQWIVSGSWGTYSGLGQQFSRLNVPLVMSDSTSPGVALVPARNGYLLIGDVEADVGTLPAAVTLFRQHSHRMSATNESRSLRPNRYIVWLKGRVSDLAEQFAGESRLPEPLFRYNIHGERNALEGDVIVVEGKIPQRLPAHWAAAEAQVEFAPLTMTSEWTPASRSSFTTPPQTSWWSDSLKFKQAVLELQGNKIQPQKVTVAVIDSGADTSHPALQGIFQINQDEVPANGVDDDANGLVDDVIGYDFISEQASPDDPFGHGTHVAGLLRNLWSSKGILGGAFNAELRIFRALDAKGKSNSVDLARAISAAIRSRVDIMNCSWGGGPETQVLKDAFAAARASEMLIFSSAGNDAINTDKFPQVPKKFPGILSIGAASAELSRARFSNWGVNSVYLFAPGTDILSTLPDGRLGEKSGTSMASPIAASVGALVFGTLRAKYPEWSRAQQIKATEDILCGSSDKNRLAAPNSKCGSINALNAIRTTLEEVR
jgi:hypothetical protein